MDFIKTSSLRALIELTFQRKWNGLIWMSRKGVIAKIAKTGPAALSRNRAKPCRRPAEERMFRANAHTTTPREPGSNASRPRNSRTTADAPSDQESRVPRPARNIGQSFIRPTTAADHETSGHDRSDVPIATTTRCPADRPDRPSERRGRPEAVFEAQSAQFKPKAGAD
ncbi:unnamed protein product [Microthlaspi erraticum]|uniref:Uncharacterized protein n=1 Tax=Microthlaspi erraticum TaxID=1685480 RepID=A0A6D2JPV3_9BRAS|nr:unnamed protein product [Microthlaspi erraticum]